MSRIDDALDGLTLYGDFKEWQSSLKIERPEEGIALVAVELTSKCSAPLPEFSLKWRIPHCNLRHRWYLSLRPDRSLPPDWDSVVSSGMTDFMPLLSLHDGGGQNCLTFAFSDTVNDVRIGAGVIEESAEIACSVAPCFPSLQKATSYHAILRLDFRPLLYSAAVSGAATWMDEIYGKRHPIPSSAYMPVYSTWYAYHQNIDAATLETECSTAREYRMSTLIVDDGWQTDDNQRGYAFCGDWETSARRFPDLRAHVERIHSQGMRFLLWYGLPLVGVNSKAFLRFQDKFLYSRDRGDSWILDPRFPEVREYLVSLLEQAIFDWNIDGFKLDFIDSFALASNQPDPCVESGDRDYVSIAPAVDALLKEIGMRCRSLKPDLLIEFRQKYVGAAVRRYADIVRAADCPGDILSNRIRTLELRLCCPGMAVHSDMISWNYGENTESAALQLLNVIFSVPQISVRLNELNSEHRKMLDFWMGFIEQYRDLLLHGELQPLYPEMNYPLVSAHKYGLEVIAVYAPGQMLSLHEKECMVVNASGDEELIFDFSCSGHISAYDVCGVKIEERQISAGLTRITVPRSGLLKFRCH
jgi:alpha-galactosidase